MSTSRLIVPTSWFSTGRFERSSNKRPKLRLLFGSSVLTVMPPSTCSPYLMPLTHSVDSGAGAGPGGGVGAAAGAAGSVAAPA